nr:T9SS type A sorting domain-containing protein [Candidatus Cloacimonadota bacterium]
ENVAGLGAEITTSANMGSTTITRGHTAQTGAGGTSIQRYYDISPTTNTALDATFVFHYNTEDLNEQEEATLSLWKSEDNGITWTEMTGTVNQDDNTITLENIDSFSRWTASDGDHSLPVTLSSFDCCLENNLPVLNWTTQSELENAGWNIYRSAEENGYEQNDYLQINSNLIAGMGTTSIPTDYSFTDDYPVQPTQTYYYWLESVSYSQELELHGPVTLYIPENYLQEMPQSSFLNKNYPNPFNPTTTLEFGIEAGETGILTIFNIRGQKILSQKFAAGYHTFNWDASQQASGVYFYRLQTPSCYQTNKMILLK